MNNAEFLTSLSPEQTAAFVALRDELLAANQVAMGEITKAKAGEIAGLDASVKSGADALKTAQDKAASDIKAKSDELAEVQSALDALKKDAATFLQNLSTVDHPEVQAAVQAATVELNKDETQKKKDALDAQIAAVQAERAKLG